MAQLTFREFVTSRVPSSPENIDTLRVTENATSVRLLWRPAIMAVDEALAFVDAQWRAKEECLHKSYLFRGAAGAGKSTALYALVHCALERGWAVLYIPQLDRLQLLRHDVAVAQAILRALQLPEGVSIPGVSDKYIEARNDDERAPALLLEIMSRLMVQDKVPLLVAIDQWNVVQDAEGLVADLFRPFDQLKMIVGVCIAAVSSSFQAPEQRMFRDADMVEREYRIPLYGDEEFAAIVDDLRQRDSLPPESEMPLANLKQICGKVPAMLGLVELTWRVTIRRGVQMWTPNETNSLRQRAITYYAERVASILDRTRHGLDNPLELERFAALVYLNKHADHLAPGGMPKSWDWSGLFNTDVYPPMFACPPVADAFYTVLSNAQTFQLDVLSSHPGTKGYAFELFFVRCFLRELPRAVTFEASKLDGSDRTEFTICVSHVVRQDRRNPVTCLEGVRDETLVVCFDGHDCVEFVLYNGAHIYMFQTSLQSYGVHKAGIEALLRPAQDLGTSVCDFYVRHGPPGVRNIKVPAARPTKHLLERVRYFYVTNDRTQHRQATLREGSRKFVWRVNGDDLAAFGLDYHLFTRSSP